MIRFLITIGMFLMAVAVSGLSAVAALIIYGSVPVMFALSLVLITAAVTVIAWFEAKGVDDHE